jgi:hypothetical protein
MRRTTRYPTKESTYQIQRLGHGDSCRQVLSRSENGTTVGSECAGHEGGCWDDRETRQIDVGRRRHGQRLALVG